MGTFDNIYILNLYGNRRTGETGEDIFDIMVGVRINIFVKYQRLSCQSASLFS
jgi:predicted helicase